MSFNFPNSVNGWSITGTTDLPSLETHPELFEANKNGRRLTLRQTVLVPSLAVKSAPSEKKVDVGQIVPMLADWRLHYNGYDVARGRNLEHILQKALSFMESM